MCPPSPLHVEIRANFLVLKECLKASMFAIRKLENYCVLLSRQAHPSTCTGVLLGVVSQRLRKDSSCRLGQVSSFFIETTAPHLMCLIEVFSG